MSWQIFIVQELITNVGWTHFAKILKEINSNIIRKLYSNLTFKEGDHGRIYHVKSVSNKKPTTITCKLLSYLFRLHTNGYDVFIEKGHVDIYIELSLNM